ncbi:PAS domain S-box protein [Sediminispirochaeta bajacaliforniensis]|uniref:PAS domain S-box protein n=1 Tax=Sediminispirochaeta bajacaliforniensis TaxID=148 RepID=UPI000376A960|nr:PAS domain S-box protein [Sediminispirochaeta bajacaliforniensis]
MHRKTKYGQKFDTRENLSREYSHYLDRLLLQSLPAITAGGAVVYLIFTFSYFFARPGMGGRFASASSLLVSIGMVSLWALIHYRRIAESRSHCISAIILLLVIANSVLHIQVLGDINESVILMLIVVADSLLFLKRAWFYTALGGTGLAWGIVTFRWFDTSPGFHSFLGMFAAMVLSILFFNIRLKYLIYSYRNYRKEKERADFGLEKLLEAEEASNILKRLTEVAVEGIVFHDGKVIVDCNDQFVELLGHSSKQELIGTDVYNIVDEKSRSLMREMVAKGYSDPYEVAGQKSDGTIFPLVIRAKTIIDSEEKMLRVAILHDLTEQRRLRDRLEKNEAQYRLLAENSTDIISRYSPKDGLIYVSPACLSILGYSPEELVGTHEFKRLIVGPNEERFGIKWLDNYGGDMVSIRKVSKKGGKESIWLESSMREVFNKETSSKEVVIVSRNVTARMQAEALRKRLASIVQFSSEGIVLLSLDGYIETWNKRAEQILGYKKKAVLHKPVSEVVELAEYSDIDGLVRRITLGASDMESRKEIETGEGPSITLSVRFSLVYDHFGNINGLVLLVRDITHQVEAERYLTVQYGVTSLIAQGMGSREEILFGIMEKLCTSLGWLGAELWLPDEEKMLLSRGGVWSSDNQGIEDFFETSSGTVFRYGEGLPGIVYSKHYPVWMADLIETSKFVRSDLAKRNGLKSSVGLCVYEGETVFAIILLFTSKRLAKNQDLIEILHAIGGQVGQLLRKKETEQELRNSESRFRAISEASPLGLFVTDNGGNCIYTNSRYQDITHLSFENALGKGWARVIHPDDIDTVTKEWYKSVEESRIYQGVHRVVVDGDDVWVSVHGAAFRDHDKVIGHVGTMEDITRQRQQDAELERYSLHLSDLVEERTKELRLLQKQLLDRQRDQQELQLAADVQRNLLPQKLPTFPGFSFSAQAYPARYVSGDFYDFVTCDDKILYVHLADIAGKGIPAALLTSSARAFLRSGSEGGLEPDAMISSVNDHLFEDLLASEKFITMQVAKINSDTGRIQYASAGHTDALHFVSAASRVERIGATSLPVGIVRQLDSEMEEIAPRPGDLFLFYSDGVTEAENENGELFGVERLEQIFLKCGKERKGNDEILQTILTAVDSFSGTEYRSDDVTLIVFSADSRFPSRQEPNVLDAIDSLASWVNVQLMGYGEEISSQVELCASELITNSIRHAYGGVESEGLGKDYVRISLELEADSIVFHLFDRGKSFRFDAVEEPNLEQANEGGYGLWLIRQVMDEVLYHPGQQGEENHWILKKRMERSLI